MLLRLSLEKIRKEENVNFVRQKPDNDGKGENYKTRVKMYQTNVKEKQKGNAHRYNRPHQKQNTVLSHPILLKRQTDRSTAYFARIAVITLTHVRPQNTQKHSRNSSAPNITHVMLV